MAASPINIAEFRCPSLHRREGNTSSPGVQESRGFRVVAATPARSRPQAETECDNPRGVFDIETGRNRHTVRESSLYRPFPFRRRANLVRLNEPHVAVMPVPVRSQMAVSAVDDRDLPPAA